MSRSSKTASARARVARAILTVARVVALLIVVGILLVVLEANPANELVSLLLDVAETLVGPFERLFTLDDRKVEVGVNWGVATVAYLVIGRILARLVGP